MIKCKIELNSSDENTNTIIKPHSYIIRALLMDWLSELDLNLVKKLHTPNEVRPYSIQVAYHKKNLVFYLNLFNSEIYQPLVNDLLNQKKKSFSINGQTFYLRKVLFEHFSIETLIKQSKSVNSFGIEFIEPTYFNTTRANHAIRLPIPELIFSNLTNLWNDTLKEQLRIEKDKFMNWVNHNIFASSYKIRTKIKEIGKDTPAVGCVGRVNFRILVENIPYTKLIDILCRFGQITNLGGGRTAGLGVIKYFPLTFFRKIP